jgi:hypothetical protein
MPAAFNLDRIGRVTRSSQIRSGYWVELDWDKLRALRGLSKTLWLLLSSHRVPFRALLDDPTGEGLIVPLDADAYRALGINRVRDRDCKRALEQAGRRMLAVDSTYREFDIVANGRRLRVVRDCAPTSAAQQLQLAA